jgi:hypothetical protein
VCQPKFMVPRQMLLTKTPCFPKRLCSIAIIDSFVAKSNQSSGRSRQKLRRVWPSFLADLVSVINHGGIFLSEHEK